VIVEKETGARYVFLDGILHPVLNHASALLIVGPTAGHIVPVSPRSLDGIPRGSTLGIPAAPDPLPGRARLLPAPWVLCSARTGTSTLYIGQSPAGGRALGEDGLLVSTPAGEVSLLWRGHRHRLTDFALGALAWRGEPPIAVAPALVNGVPAGPDLAAIAIAGRGGRSRAGFARVGQVFVVHPQGGPPRYAVAVPDGLAAVSQVQANLLLGDPQTLAVQGQPGAIELPLASYAGAPVADPLAQAGGELAPPAAMPALAHLSTVDGAVCAGMAGTGISVDVPAAGAGTSTGSSTGAGGVLADRVAVPPGRGAVVESMAAPDAGSGALCLVTELGLRYAVPDVDVLATLGYAGVTPVRVPAALVALVPAGPALDPLAARQPSP
jgi:type VII secretion protein EccB